MNFTVYLPDELGERIRSLIDRSDLNLSGLLRGAVIDELSRREALETLEDGMEHIELELRDDDGNEYLGEFDGHIFGQDENIYLTADERIFMYDESNQVVHEYDHLAEISLQDWLGDKNAYIALMNALGETPRIAL